MIHLIRCVHENVFHDIKQNVFNGDCVGVYYGFNSYNASINMWLISITCS